MSDSSETKVVGDPPAGFLRCADATARTQRPRAVFAEAVDVVNVPSSERPRLSAEQVFGMEHLGF